MYVWKTFTNHGLRILDSGSAAGTWAFDVASKCTLSTHYFLSTDINSTIFLVESSKDFDFLQHDIRTPFPTNLHNSFDFAHQRNVLAGAYGTPLKQSGQNLTDTIEPGGWIQLIELDDDVLPESNGPAYTTFIKLVRHIMRMLGVPNIGAEFKPTLEAIGFVNVQEKIFRPHMWSRIVATAPHLCDASVEAPCGAVPQLLKANGRIPKPVNKLLIKIDTIRCTTMTVYHLALLILSFICTVMTTLLPLRIL
ncbi:Methyltransferase psoC [Fulvia fulva]|uniref:Methyltransferase psoC n=1 Tax=Passalora fulva TaxID=5499 RepID=A0A9Q8PLY9_PASFU|nr:Methyltransferase psoC [Fulvia fulva]KAK4609012.1 Methyltransferase psoC [Fulvia fulva]KAK4609873.1 Methyltransferase psoC [Fulvia fulva]UJO24975.1 Methyltransferase psoC [Fulvia fulva]WPV22913.1 Methyltransferase psoC [Fulvia fulva]WPV37724.1 Methyltransferase psoC [Fulvia fulva]